MFELLGSKKVSSPGIAIQIGLIVLGAIASGQLHTPLPLLAGFLLGLYCLFSIKVVRQWEKVAVLRFGKFRHLQCPGVFWLIPVVDSLSAYVDQRIRVSNVSAESTLTRDTVPVNVDAIIFWVVWNAEKSIFEVSDYTDARVRV